MKKFIKILVLTLALWQALFSTGVSVALAQEASGEPTPTPEVVMITGDTAAGSEVLAETNIVEVETTSSPEPSPEITSSPSPDPEATPLVTLESVVSPSPTPDPEATASATLESIVSPIPTPTPNPNTISIDQSGSASIDSSASSNSGENTQTASGSADMVTGDAMSVASNINVTNLAEIDSNIVTTIQTIYSDESGDIDVYQLLIDAIAANPNSVPEGADITVNQCADVLANTQALSSSGENLQDADTADMQTGDATSVSSAINAVNLNLIGSNVVLFIINILGDYSGNIILPNGQTFSLAELGIGNVNVVSNQSADVSANTQAISGTGENTQIGEDTNMITGDATSTSNSDSFVNLVQIGGGWGYLVINNSGNWTGNLINWTAPGSVEVLPQGTTNLTSNWQGTEGVDSGTTNIISNQMASLSTNVSANSNTGRNSQNGQNSTLTTGNAFSLANNFTLANITGIGAGLFFGIINIFSNWTGNLVSGPYIEEEVVETPTNVTASSDPPADTRSPELKITVNNNVGEFIYPGDTVLANITVVNQSAFTAHNVEVKGQLTNDHPMPAIPMNWKIGDLRPNGRAKISFSITLTSDLPGGQYKISAIAEGSGDSGNISSSDGESTFWVKAKGVLTQIVAPEVMAESDMDIGGEVLGISTSKSPLDIYKYLIYILPILAAAYLFILFARKKLRENEQN